jgi:hypothetical protein
MVQQKVLLRLEMPTWRRMKEVSQEEPLDRSKSWLCRLRDRGAGFMDDEFGGGSARGYLVYENGGSCRGGAKPVAVCDVPSDWTYFSLHARARSLDFTEFGNGLTAVLY